MKRDVHDTGFEPDIAILYCRRTVAGDARPATSSRGGDGFRARLVMMPCSSKVQVPDVMRILERGADGVLVVGCAEDACQFQVGSRMASKRVERARGLLREIGFGEERVSMEHGADLSEDDLVTMARKRADAVRPLGPSPMKEERQG